MTTLIEPVRIDPALLVMMSTVDGMNVERIVEAPFGLGESIAVRDLEFERLQKTRFLVGYALKVEGVELVVSRDYSFTVYPGDGTILWNETGVLWDRDKGPLSKLALLNAAHAVERFAADRAFGAVS